MLKWIWIFSGDDYRIIADCNKTIKFKFAIIGGLVISLILLSLLSVQIAIESLFHSALLGLVVGSFFALVLSILYLLLLQTLSPNLLPHIKPKTIENSRWLRYVFIVFIAITISKPIEYQILKSETVEITNNLKTRQLAELTQAIHKIEQAQLGHIDKELNSIHLSERAKTDFLSIKKEIKNDKDRSLAKAFELVNNSRFFIKGMQALHEKHPFIWGISLITVILFLLPILIKLSIPRSSDYVKQKEKTERSIVDNHYNLTKELYAQLFWEKHKRILKFHETHDNGPYNTIKIEKNTKIYKQADLVKLIYKKK